jgi:hypothetical protein
VNILFLKIFEKEIKANRLELTLCLRQGEEEEETCESLVATLVAGASAFRVHNPCTWCFFVFSRSFNSLGPVIALERIYACKRSQGSFKINMRCGRRHLWSISHYDTIYAKLAFLIKCSLMIIWFWNNKIPRIINIGIAGTYLSQKSFLLLTGPWVLGLFFISISNPHFYRWPVNLVGR